MGSIWNMALMEWITLWRKLRFSAVYTTTLFDGDTLNPRVKKSYE